jgi:hypothetical protein
MTNEQTFPKLVKELSRRQRDWDTLNYPQLALLIQRASENELRQGQSYLTGLCNKMSTLVTRVENPVPYATFMGRFQGLAYQVEARLQLLGDQEKAAVDLKITLEELEIGMRAYNTFRRTGIDSVSMLVSMSEAGVFLVLEAYGDSETAKMQLDEVKKALEKHGLCLSND